MKFELHARDAGSSARAGLITTDYGLIETPVFMPVGTAATVKAIHNKDIKEQVNPDIILGNTYHLFLRPGLEVLSQAGGINRFMAWNKPVLNWYAASCLMTSPDTLWVLAPPKTSLNALPSVLICSIV